MAIRRGIITQPNAVKIDSRLPKGAVMTGESMPDGKPVLQEQRVLTERRVRRGPDGTVLHWPNAQGGPSDRPAYERVVVGQEPDVFVEAEMDNGMAWKNRNFRPTAEELARRKKEADRQLAITELGDIAGEMKSEGMNLRDLIDAIRGGKKPDEPTTNGEYREPTTTDSEYRFIPREPVPVTAEQPKPRRRKGRKGAPTKYQRFIGDRRREGMSMAAAQAAWRDHKENGG